MRNKLWVVVVALCAMLSAVVAIPTAVSAQDADTPPDEPVEVPVVAVDDLEWTDVGETVDIEVTANDSDDSDAADVTIEVVAEPADGTTEIVVEEGEPSIEFTPAAGFDGVTTFTYEACVDGSCDSAEVRVFVGVSACTIVGTNGRNTLTGTDGDDVICGRRGADTIDAGAGDDIVFGGRGADTIVGGAGDDVLRGGRGNDTISGGVGDDEIHGARGTDILDGGEGADLIFGGKGPDTITGGAGDDELIGKAGDDVINGDAGDDVLRGWRGNDILDGGDGHDVLHGGRHADELVGGPGDDDLRGKLGADVIDAGPGNDVVYGGRGADVAHGGDGEDQVRGNRGNDTLDGGNGTDTLNGGTGTDTCDDAEGAVNCETETTNGEPAGPEVESVCLAIQLPGGDYGLSLDFEQLDMADSHTLRRSVDGGPESDLVVLGPGEVEFKDENAPAGSVSYSYAAQAGSSVDCEEAPYEVGFNLEDIGVPLLEDGTPGVTDTDSEAVMLDHNNYSSSPASSAAEASESICSTGLRRDMGQSFKPWTRVFVPEGLRLEFDVKQRINPDTGRRGNWAASVDLYTVHPNGVDYQYFRDDVSLTTSFYWNEAGEQDAHNRVLNYQGRAGGEEVFLTIQLDTAVSIYPDEGEWAYISIENMRYVDDDGEVVAYPCMIEDSLSCFQAGGNLVLTEPVTHDGVTYSGCVKYDSCLSGLSSVAGFVAELACGNMTALSYAFWGASAVALTLAGGMILLPTLQAAAASFSVAMAGSGAAGGAAGGGVGALFAPEILAAVGASAMAGSWALTNVLTADFELGDISLPVWGPSYDFDVIDEEAFIEMAQTLTPNPAEYGVVDGEIAVVAGATAVSAMADAAGFEPDPDASPAEQLSARRFVEYGLATCLAQMTVAKAQEFLVAAGWGPVEAMADLMVVEEALNLHLCSRITIIIPGSVAQTSGSPLAQATLHIREAVFGSPPVDEYIHDGPDTVVNGQTGRSDWLFLSAWRNRSTSNPRSGWYTNTDFSCVAPANSGLQCDEYPLRSTQQGVAQGPDGEIVIGTVTDGVSSALPHLRFINGSHNTVSGREFQTFYNRCGLSTGDPFMSVPVWSSMLAIDAAVGFLTLAPTRWVGPDCVDS